MSNIVYLGTLLLLVNILCMSCDAAVGDTDCTDDANCTISYSKCDTDAGKCQCIADYYDDGTDCQPKGNNGESCKNGVDSCLYANLFCQSSNLCTCNNTNTHYWDSGTTTCKPKGNNGESCKNGVDSCLHADLFCQSSNLCTCNNTNTDYWDSGTKTCKPKGNNGESCKNGVDSCLHADLFCQSSNLCTCNNTNTDYWDSGTKTCKPKKALSENCTAHIECLVANSECASKCQCQVNFYDTNNTEYGGTCDSLTNLNVSNIQLTTRSEKYLIIQWTAPQAAAAVEEYRFLVGGTSSEVSVGKQLEANVTGLTPGVMYTITVISVDSNSRPTAQKTSPQPVNQATKPAVPGPIDLVNSDLTASDNQIIIRWNSTGTVMSYTVTISELVINPAVVNNPYIMIGGNVAKNGHRYTLTVKAHSNSLKSAEYTEEFRTVITQPNPPIIQSCTEIVSTSIDLVWQEPQLPNGDVQYYLIDTNGASAPPQINTSTSVATYKVEPLLEAHTYCFFVRTVNDGAKDIQVSWNSNKLCCSTRADSSSEPTNVTTNVLSSRNISVSWNYPDNPKGDIFGYRLRLKVNDICQVEIIFYCTECPNAQNIPYKDCGEDKQRQTITLNKNQINTTINYIVEQLLPYTKYDVWIAAHNAANDGMRHDSAVQTISEVPQKPLSVAASVMSSSEITVTWNQSLPRPGVTTYHVTAYEVVNGVNEFVKISNVSGYSTQTVGFSQLEAYWNYTFTVVATTDKGDSEQSEMSPIVRTNEDAPGKVLNFKVDKPNEEHTKMKVVWSIPELRNRNGLIKEYTVEHNTTGTTLLSTVDATMDNLEILFNITPEQYYEIKVYAINTKNEKGAAVEEVYYAWPGPPNVPQIPALVEETSSPPSTQTTIEVKFSLDWFLNKDNGKRTDGGIVICPKSSCDNYGETSQMKEPSHFATLTTWKQSRATGFTQAYRVTNRTWINDHVSSSGRRKRSNKVVELTIGEDTDCNKLADDVYCNGPLPADIRIIVIAFVCTSGGCTESKPYGPYKTQPEPEGLPIAIIAGVASAVVVFVIVIIIIVVIKKNRRKHKPMEEDKEIDDFNDLNPHHLETPSVERKNIRKKRPIAMKDFEAKVAELHKDSNLKFAHEYEELKTLTDPKTLKHVSTSLAETEENKLKNRYVNILPYDHTIVKLLPLEDDDEQASTFINANYIPGYKSQREYIASQGPIPSTIDDFWRMVWEQSVSIIVMLTLAKEDGRIKCEMYWPTEQSEAKQFGDIVVEMQSCSTINTYEFRIFKMTLGDKSRTLKHFHFLNWKDFSANVQNDVMVDFISNVRSHVTIPESRVPMIVHCSAGVGRTGTFIALDHMMQFIRDHDFDSTIDIFDFVVKMRECRMYMVQTEQQYIFIHDCIKDILEKKRQKELEDGDGLYGNVDNDQDHNIYSNEAFEPEPELYQNFAIGQPKTEL